MAYKGLFNTEKSDYTKNPLFLGEDLGLHDSVNIQYPELEALYRQAVAQNWSDKEFDFSRDAKQFAENSVESQMMIDTIATQWEMDSVASRSMLSLLAPFITNTELYELVAFNSYIECVHSGTYSEIVRNAFPDPKAVIDDILSKEDAMTRATLIGQVMEDLYVVGHKFSLGQLTKEEVFPTLYKGIVALFLLERGQFVASFAITFALGEAGMFQECAAAIRKVCADEVQIHASADVVMLRELRKMGYWEDYKDNEEFQSSINAFVEEVYQGELLWTEQLFKDRGSLCGLSCQDIKDWVTFNFQIIRQELDLPVEITIKENPLPYMEKWMSLNALQQANQETTSLAYLLDATKDDSAEAELDF